MIHGFCHTSLSRYTKTCCVCFQDITSSLRFHRISLDLIEENCAIDRDLQVRFYHPPVPAFPPPLPSLRPLRWFFQCYLMQRIIAAQNSEQRVALHRALDNAALLQNSAPT
ncbi:hypothetical protein FQA47_005982 [Oryzias melastigma]|uniref:Uncharacterized protein n=1 Tax=Oryzias melastigma TaxID=30732 RepID=A0A834BQ60_ORYME|nr:hypothetical protein FQA47_005982 [Oryzias melastigma]